MVRKFPTPFPPPTSPDWPVGYRRCFSCPSACFQCVCRLLGKLETKVARETSCWQLLVKVLTTADRMTVCWSADELIETDTLTQFRSSRQRSGTIVHIWPFSFYRWRFLFLLYETSACVAVIDSKGKRLEFVSVLLPRNKLLVARLGLGSGM